MPPRHRTNSIATLAMSIIAIPSCPAPLGSSNTRYPSPAKASDTWSLSHGAHGTVRFSWVTSSCSFSLRRLAMFSIWRTMSATASLRCASEGARISMVNDTFPGMTLVAPGVAWMYPTVPTSPPWPVRQNSSIATMHSAAPASASRRSGIGTVPAWPAMPVRLAARRVAQRNSGAVLYPQHALVERSRDRPAPQQRGREPDALLVGEPGHLDRERQSLSSSVQLGEAGNRRDQP